MEKEKSANLKLKITAFVLSFVLLAAVGALVGVFAASTQGLNSSFSVSYTLGKNLAARVRTEKYVPNLDSDGDGTEDGAVNIIYDSNENEIERDAQDYVVFNANDNTSEKDVYIGEVNLNPYASKAYFYFTIESLMDSGYIRVLCTPTYNEDRKNIDADIAYCNIDEHTGFDAAQSASTIAEDDWTKAHYNNIPAGGYKMIRVELSVHDVNKTANCGGTFDIQLDYSTVTGLEALDDDTKSTIQSNTTAEQIIFAYAEEQPEGAAQTNAAKPMADTTKKIWTRLDGTTLYVYSNYTIDLPADSSFFFAERSTLKTLDLTNFNTSNVTTMEKMFLRCTALKSINLSNFDTSNVTNMFGIFGACSALTELDLSSFNTAKVETLKYMFYQCEALEKLNLSHFNTTNVTDMNGVFRTCSNLKELDISGFDTSNVTTMVAMFYECRALENLDVDHFATSEVKDMSFMFGECNALKNVDVSNFNTENVTTMYGMFGNCYALTSLDVSNFNTENVTTMEGMFNNCYTLMSLNVSNFVTENVTTMMIMFQGCEKLTTIDVSNFNTSNVTDMSYMFNECKSLTSLDVSGFDTSSVGLGPANNPGSMMTMFQHCDNLVFLDVSNFNTSNVTDMSYMFGSCYKLINLDVSNFDTSKVKIMSYMFVDCTSLVTIYASDLFVVSQNPTSAYMFTGSTKLEGAISYSSSKVTHAYANYTTGYFTYKAPKAEGA